MPGFKQDASKDPPTAPSSTGCSPWKLYENPYYVAAVASAVVEATLKLPPRKADSEIQDKQFPGSDCKKQSSREPIDAQQKAWFSQARKSNKPKSHVPAGSKNHQPGQRDAEAGESNNRLRAELLNAWASMQKLAKALEAAKAKVNRLSRQLEDGRSLWESQVQDKITSSAQALKHRLKEEREANRLLELQNRELEHQVDHIRGLISQANKETAGEVQAKQMVEDVCQELVEQVGAEESRSQELRRQSLAAKKEIEEARKRMQIAEVWKEEQIQARLSTSRFEFEDRNIELEFLMEKITEFLEDRDERSRKESVDKATFTRTLLLNGSRFHSKAGGGIHGGSPRTVYPSTTPSRTKSMPKIWPTSSKQFGN